jgi:spermidine synthase
MGGLMTTLDLPALDTITARRAPWTKTLCVLFFFSGFPALIYQLTWQRELFRIFGVNSESVTIVVSAFMLGLGLGSLAGGWLSVRRGISPCPCWPRLNWRRPPSALCRSVCSNRSAR